MNLTDFNFYREENELPGGAYWQFLDCDMSDFKYLDDNNIFYKISSQLEQIKNEELKEKLKNKIKDYILEYGLAKCSVSFSIFSNSDINEIFLKELDFVKDKFNNALQKEYITFIDLFDSIFSLITTGKLNVDILERGIRTILEYLNGDENRQIINKYYYIKDNNYDGISIMNSELLSKLERYCLDVLKKMFLNFPYPILPTYSKVMEVNSNPQYIYNKFLSECSSRTIGIDSKISIGLEVEINYLINMNFSLGNQKNINRFSQGTDATVPNGFEFVTPVMHDNDKDIGLFCAFMDTLKEMGFYYDEVSKNAGGQINLGLDYLDTKEAVLNFFDIFSNVEELLFYISNEPDSLMRQPIYRNSRFKPVSECIGKRNISELQNREDVLELFSADNDRSSFGFDYKRTTVCVRDMYDTNRARLEFRIPNSSINANTWLDNIRLYGKIMEVAKYLSNLKQEDYISDRDNEMLNLKEELYFNESLEEKLNTLLDLLFTDEKIKQIYRDRFYGTIDNINKQNSGNYDWKRDRNIFSEPAFSSVDFQDVTPSGSILVASWDPDEENNNHKSR